MLDELVLKRSFGQVKENRILGLLLSWKVLILTMSNIIRLLPLKLLSNFQNVPSLEVERLLIWVGLV